MLFLRLHDEIITGLYKLFPVQTNDGVNFRSLPEAHPYVGQLFDQVVIEKFRLAFWPIILGWIKELKEKNDQSFEDTAVTRCRGLLKSLVVFEKKYGKESLLHETAFNNHLGMNWYLPTVDQDEESSKRLITPIERLLQRVVDLKGYQSRQKLATDAVSHYDNEDWKESAEFALEKSLDRMKKGDILTLPQLQKLRKVSFAKFIVDDHWASRSDAEKDELINELREVYHPSPMTEEEVARFNSSWRKMYDDQNKYFKDVVDGIYELGLIMTFLITRVIRDLEKYYPGIGEQFAELNSKSV